MADQPHRLNDSGSDDDVLLLMTLRTVVELMGDDIDSLEGLAALPGSVTGFINDADVSQLKRLLLRAATQLADRLTPANDDENT